MRTDSSNIFTIISTTFGTIVTIVSENVVYQVIIGILTILGLLFNISYTAWKWYKNASRDGKITPEEIEDLIDEEYDLVKGKDDE